MHTCCRRRDASAFQEIAAWYLLPLRATLDDANTLKRRYNAGFRLIDTSKAPDIDIIFDDSTFWYLFRFSNT